MSVIEFANPKMFFLLLILVPIIVFYLLRQRSLSTVQVSSVKAVEGLGSPFKQWLAHILFGLKLIAFALLIAAMARPQSTNRWENVNTLGIDIILALDVSGSMLAQDFHPDRLEASKNVAIEFISGRPNDRLGLVVFSGESFTQCPLTTDHVALINLFKGVQSGIIDDGTALGVGLANAVKRLKDSDAVSKVVILLTDGVNNMGAIDPLTAAELAKTFGIRVYTIGVGTEGTAPIPGYDRWGRRRMMQMQVEIDESSLQRIAEITDGKYYRAKDNNRDQ